MNTNPMTDPWDWYINLHECLIFIAVGKLVGINFKKQPHGSVMGSEKSNQPRLFVSLHVKFRLLDL